ncbi:hypothetical protein GW17_00007923 [Ensete ventricosum]|nr:hypothetical protein GW17_00007923 [Ensete ventricosum]RZR93789.1 hypothetical protein BHM03_00022363 [Ensete ventricosum]
MSDYLDTAHYRAVPPKSIVNDRLRKKNGRRRRGKEERIPRAVLALCLRTAVALALAREPLPPLLAIFLPREEKD